MNTVDNLFLKATRSKFRFDTTKGKLSVEELWDLPLQSKTNQPNLDDIAKALHRQLKSDDTISFVTTSTTSDVEVRSRFDIVKFVIDTKVAENTAEAAKRTNAEKKQRLLGVLENLENEALTKLSADEIRKQIAAL